VRQVGMAAVTMSPTHVSSIVKAMPSETHRSRICRALVSPPTLEIFQVDDIHCLVSDSLDHDAQACPSLHLG